MNPIPAQVASKLILIEGLPGAGKTSTAVHLGEYLIQKGCSCQWFLEEDEGHPIDLTDMALKDLSKELIPLWESFMRSEFNHRTVTIMESRLWQNTSLFMFMAEFPTEEILELQDQVNATLAPLAPILIYLHQPDVAQALGRLYDFREDEWMEWALNMTSTYAWFQNRGKRGFSGWLHFFSEWLEFAEDLYRLWPHRKVKIHNPHDDWAAAYSRIHAFLRFNEVI